MKFFSRKNKIDGEQGFTLVETLVAVGIFSVSIAAVISVTAQGVSSTTAAKNRLIGNYLAQETIEYVRHLRNKYTPVVGVSANWNQFVDMIGSCSGKYCVTADPTESNPTTEVIPCGDQIDQTACSDFPVVYDTDTGYFLQPSSTSPNTPFRRYFTIEIVSANEIKIISTVAWNEKNNNPKNVTLTETLTNWLPN